MGRESQAWKISQVVALSLRRTPAILDRCGLGVGIGADGDRRIDDFPGHRVALDESPEGVG